LKSGYVFFGNVQEVIDIVLKECMCVINGDAAIVRDQFGFEVL
jgi:hypothetical protein